MSNQIITDAIRECLEIIRKEGVARLKAQGHDVTGQGINSITLDVDGFIGSAYGQHYLLAQDTGIQAGRYKPSRTLLDAIIRWIENGGLKGRVFTYGGKPMTVRKTAKTIINTQKRNGMHTRGGNHFQQAQGWLTDTITENEKIVRDILEKAGFDYFDAIIKSMIEESKRNIQ
jgi:hypothetical protein